MFIFFWGGVGFQKRLGNIQVGKGMHSLIKRGSGVFVHLMCLSDQNVFPLFSPEINTQHFLFFPRFSLFSSKSHVFSSEPNQMLENYFVAGHLCLRKAASAHFRSFLLCKNKARDIIIWFLKLRQFSNKCERVGSSLCASFACCAIWLQPPSCNAP